MEKLYVIKIGGNIIDDNNRLSQFLESFAAITGKKILVHGGGKLANRLADDISGLDEKDLTEMLGVLNRKKQKKK